MWWDEMLDKIINFYKENVSYYSLVFKYKKGIYVTFFVSTLLSVLTLTAFAIAVSVKANVIACSVCFVLSLVFTVIMFLLLNKAAKKVLKSKYRIESNRFIWKCEAFEEKQTKLLTSYLKQKGILSEKKIKLLIDLYQNEKE